MESDDDAYTERLLTLVGGAMMYNRREGELILSVDRVVSERFSKPTRISSVIRIDLCKPDRTRPITPLFIVTSRARQE